MARYQAGGPRRSLNDALTRSNAWCAVQRLARRWGGSRTRPLTGFCFKPSQGSRASRRSSGTGGAARRRTSWTTLVVDGYDEVILSLREAGLDYQGFWRVERWWSGDGA